MVMERMGGRLTGGRLGVGMKIGQREKARGDGIWGLSWGQKNSLEVIISEQNGEEAGTYEKCIGITRNTSLQNVNHMFTSVENTHQTGSSETESTKYKHA